LGIPQKLASPNLTSQKFQGFSIEVKQPRILSNPKSKTHFQILAIHKDITERYILSYFLVGAL